MRYVMKQKLFSFTDSYVIRNEAGDDMFSARGKLLSFGNQLSFDDMAGNELAYIRQKLIAFTPTYEIYRGDTHFATVKQDFFTFMRHSFSVDIPGPDDLEAQGDFLDHEYRFTRHDREVAVVSKHWFSFTDTYGVDINPGEDDVLILASAVVIDMICHDKPKE